MTMPSLNLRVGVLYEGNVDTSYVKALIRKLLSERGVAIDGEIKAYKVGTAIVKYIPIYMSKFVDRDLIVLLTDGDGGQNNKQQMMDKVEVCAIAQLPKVVSGVPEPHLEKWIIADENAVKTVLGLPGSQPLPHPSLKPKDRLIQLVNNGEFEGTLDEAKVAILENSRIIDMCRHASDFNSFKSDLDNFLNTVQ
jgi:hypothetical protein